MVYFVSTATSVLAYVSDEEYNILRNSSQKYHVLYVTQKLQMALKFFDNLQDRQNILNAKFEDKLVELNKHLKLIQKFLLQRLQVPSIGVTPS